MKSLLGLSGNPSALSRIAPHPRFAPSDSLVGRIGDIEWILGREGDSLLVGDPGSGKTFLLRNLVLGEHGLFMTQNDRSEVASAIRDQAPSTVFLDDPFASPESVRMLRQLREELGVDFKILATAWSGDQRSMQEVMGLATTEIRKLRLLTRDEIVEVIKGTGIGGPRSLVRELVTQAAGRPGLAATLAWLVQAGDGQKVALGEALRDHLGSKLDRLVGRASAISLGAFAVGGSAGMDYQRVAKLLTRSVEELLTDARLLSAGGVLRPVDSQRFAVWPPALRWALIRENFFSGVGDLSLEAFREVAADRTSLLEALVGAAHCGARIPQLSDHLEESGSLDAWSGYAALGKREARWVLRRHPEKLKAVAQACLRVIPAEVIQALCEAALVVEPDQFNRKSWPIQGIETWIWKGSPFSTEAIDRRRHLAKSFAVWATKKKEIGAASEAAWLALRPGFERVESDPGAGMTVTITRGILTPADLVQVVEIWRILVPALREHISEIAWSSLFAELHGWLYPESVGLGKGVTEETREATKLVATRILQDLAELTREEPAVLQKVQAAGEVLGLALEVVIDSDYSILFPAEGFDEGWEESEVAERVAVRRLAEKWLQKDVASVVTRLLGLEREADRVKKSYPRHTPLICREIAEQAKSPSSWVEALVARRAKPDLLAPFLEATVNAAEPGSDERLCQLLDDGLYTRVALMTGLAAHELDAATEDLLLAQLTQYDSNWVQTWCLRGDVPALRLARLLRHPLESIATAAAVGEWLNDPKWTVRAELVDAWEQVIASARSEEHCLGEILAGKPELGKLWLSRILASDDPSSIPSQLNKTIEIATASLDDSQKAHLIDELRLTYWHCQLARALVGRRASFYRQLLRLELDADLHLAPLAGDPTDLAWQELAILASEHGYGADEIFGAVFGSSQSWSGPESDYWSGWRQKFASIADNRSAILREVAGVAVEALDRTIAAARAREEQEAIYGY